MKNRNSNRIRSIALAKETELLQLNTLTNDLNSKLTNTSGDTFDIDIKSKLNCDNRIKRRQNAINTSVNDNNQSILNYHQNIQNDDTTTTTDIETDTSEKYQNRNYLRTNTRGRKIIVSSSPPPPADGANTTLKDFENLTNKRRRRLEKY